MVKLVNIVV